MPGMMNGLYNRLAHQSRRANGAIEAGMVDHFDDGADAATLFANELRPSLGKLNFSRSVGAIAHLVLEPLNVKMIAFTRGRPSREQETREAFGRLGQNQECIAHARGAKPFMSGNQVFIAPAKFLGACGVGAYVG